MILRPEYRDKLITAYKNIISQDNLSTSIAEDHLIKTPLRIAETLEELLDGCGKSPADFLNTSFTSGNYDEIVFVNDIQFVSLCAHHFLPFFGKMHFGYLPNAKIVGLSKIPRLVKMWSRRPQVQEKLTQDIVDSFNTIVNPKGCGLVIEAYHLCMMIRGVEQKTAYTRTSALRGTFKTNELTRQEFLDGVKQSTSKIWP